MVAGAGWEWGWLVAGAHRGEGGGEVLVLAVARAELHHFTALCRLVLLVLVSEPVGDPLGQEACVEVHLRTHEARKYKS